jgi:hypothetical protein
MLKKFRKWIETKKADAKFKEAGPGEALKFTVK